MQEAEKGKGSITTPTDLAQEKPVIWEWIVGTFVIIAPGKRPVKPVFEAESKGRGDDQTISG
ncbi:MAG: hypothetical protein WDN28_30815 [Chthoniobacter sp.]